MSGLCGAAGSIASDGGDPTRAHDTDREVRHTDQAITEEEEEEPADSCWSPHVVTLPAATTRMRATQPESTRASSQRGKRKGSSPSKERKSAKLANHEEEKNAEAEAEVASASPRSGNTTSSGSVVSSPLRCPQLPRAVVGVTAFGDQILEPIHQIDPAIVRAHDKLVDRYAAKQRRQLKLVSLDQSIPHSCMLDSELLPVRESAEKSILQVAKAVIGFSSYIEGKLLRRTSGFLIDWDANKKTGTVLTSAFLIQSKSPSLDQWLATDEYSPHAEVHVHLMDKSDTTVVAELLHYDKHYNLALFKISKDLEAQIPSFTSDLNFAEEVFVVGRDEGRHLTIDHGKVEYKGPSHLHRHHYMFITCGINRLGIGGPVIKHGGKVAGMFSLPEKAFTPSSTILKCLQMWKTFDCIPRLHVGMKFSAISFLDLPHREKIACKCDVNDGLIVKQVCQGSVAEKVGVRRGDIIKSWNGENISTTIELENFLLDMCKKHLDKGNSIGSSVDLSIGIFYVRKDSHDTIKMSVNVSDDIEVVAEGIYPVTTMDCTMVDDDVDDSLIYGEAPTDDEDDEIGSYRV